MVIKSQVWCVATEIEFVRAGRAGETPVDRKRQEDGFKTMKKLSKACETLLEDTGKNRQVKRT